MSQFIRQKQVEGLIAALAAKANDNQVLKIANNLSEVNASQARTNLDIYSTSEVNALIVGAENAFSVATIAERNALTGLKISDRIFVSDDGDGQWALYIVTAITNGSGSTSTYQKIADADLFTNAISAAAIKAAYESNSNTNAFTDAEQAKVAHITVTGDIDLDTTVTVLAAANATANTALTTANSAVANAATAQSTANTALSDAAAAQSTANTALANANTALSTKEDKFTQTMETFLGIVKAPNLTMELVLTQSLAAGFVPQVFFNGLQLNSISYTIGSNKVSVTVPYSTEADDALAVYYCHI
jgi:hypothetical protein